MHGLNKGSEKSMGKNPFKFEIPAGKVAMTIMYNL